MKTLNFIKREMLNWLFILLPVIYILLIKEKLPPFAPFQAGDEQRIYQLIIFVMGVALIAYLIFLIKPAIVPKTVFHENLKVYHTFRTLVLAFTSLLCLTFISEKSGMPYNWGRIGFILSFAFIMVIGNIYPTIRYNFMIGIKNVWTRQNEYIWKKTHSLAGKVYFFGGLIGVLYGIFFNIHPVEWMPVLLVSYVFGLMIIPTVYSFLLFRRSR